MIYGYAWKTEGASGYECFDSKIDRDNDLRQRLEESPSPKPAVVKFEGIDGDSEGEKAIDFLLGGK